MYDMHTHTSFSEDCSVPLEISMKGAAGSGLDGIAITDHFDPGYPDPDFSFYIDFPAYDKWVKEQQRAYEGQLDILYGLEVGILKSELEAAKEKVKAYDYDFVIGSFHCYDRGKPLALDLVDYDQLDRAETHVDFYQYMHDCLKEFHDYDVIGHYTIIDRYIGRILDLSPAEEMIRETLSMIIEEGKGIEINTSHKKYGMPVELPRREILQWYRELGGEILTIGSDTHEANRYGDGFDEAAQLARSLGFRYYTVFHQRKPRFFSLP